MTAAHLTTSLAFSSQSIMSGPVRRVGLIMRKTPQAIGPARRRWIQRDAHNGALNLWTRRERGRLLSTQTSRASVCALTVSSQINRWPRGGGQEPLLGVTLDPLLLAGAFIPLQMREEMYWAEAPLSWPLGSLGEFHRRLLVPTRITQNTVELRHKHSATSTQV